MMTQSFEKDFILPDGTEVQVREQFKGCYQLMLLDTVGKEDTFTWDASETRDVLGARDLPYSERRRNEALQELWKLI